jgi:transcriptional regulator of acetoin/glycerol metabolism
MERAVLLATGDTIRPSDLHLELHGKAPVNGEESSLSFREIQQLHIQKALTAEHGNVGRAAARLEMTRSTLYNKMRTFGINPRSYQK